VLLFETSFNLQQVSGQRPPVKTFIPKWGSSANLTSLTVQRFCPPMKEEGSITLTTSEQRRLLVLNQLEAGALVGAEAAQLLNLSVRQLRHLRSNYRKRGAVALSHGNRGRQPHNAVDPDLARRVVELATTTYAGFNQQHLTEMLAEEEDVRLSRPTVHRILKAAGVPAPRCRRPPRHRRRRDRYPREGMLIQLDASRHDWLEGRGPHPESARRHRRCHRPGALGLLSAAGGRPGLLRGDARDRAPTRHPMAAYTDRHSIFVQTKQRELALEEQLSGRRLPTQFGRLMGERRVELIHTRSPQAKGRMSAFGPPSRTASHPKQD
jgi:transposase